MCGQSGERGLNDPTGLYFQWVYFSFLPSLGPGWWWAQCCSRKVQTERGLRQHPLHSGLQTPCPEWCRGRNADSWAHISGAVHGRGEEAGKDGLTCAGWRGEEEERNHVKSPALLPKCDFSGAPVWILTCGLSRPHGSSCGKHVRRCSA